MSDAQSYLDLFPGWLGSLGTDARTLGDLLSESDLPQPARELITAGVNYVFKSLDLIPDGIDDIGYLDDAFVLRVAAALARDEFASGDSPASEGLERLATENDTIREFLADDYQRLAAYVQGLRKGAARGRSVPDILEDNHVREEFLRDVRGFEQEYEAPSFAKEEKNLIKLKAFFDAKLPK